MHLNPFAWKMQNIEKLYSSYVERLVNAEKQKKILSLESEKDMEKMVNFLKIIGLGGSKTRDC